MICNTLDMHMILNISFYFEILTISRKSEMINFIQENNEFDATRES